MGVHRPIKRQPFSSEQGCQNIHNNITVDRRMRRTHTRTGGQADRRLLLFVLPSREQRLHASVLK